MLQPCHGFFQCGDGFCLKNAAGVPLPGQAEPFRQIDFPVTQGQMVFRGRYRSVVDVEMNQPVPVLQQKRNILFAGGVSVPSWMWK